MIQLFKQRLISLLLTLLFIVGLTACTPSEPPVEFTPDGAIIQKAITLQLEQTERRLSQQLKVSPPTFDISKIEVKNNDPVFINELAAYHLTGTYRLILQLPHRKVTQKKNPFDIYLQRQAEGKTWRLLTKTLETPTSQPQWSSYLIQVDAPIIEPQSSPSVDSSS
ncbi:MAG: hypothetical protein AB4041_02935 [Microcystaceae cyanobacterium]